MQKELMVPVWCPVCQGAMMGKSTNTYYDYGCCVTCFINFIEGSKERKERWKSGWRPSKEELSVYDL